MLAPSPHTAVLHVALNPVTGPWSVMRELAKAQAKSGLYAGSGIGLITYADWPSQYEAELDSLSLPAFRARTPRMFGTASFLWQCLHKPPIRRWVREFAVTTGANSVVVHFHNAWLSGVFVPIAYTNGITVKTVATVHGVTSDFNSKAVRHWLHRWMAHRLVRYGVSLTSVDSQSLKVLEAACGIPARNFSVVHNGVPALTLCRATTPPSLTVGHVGTLNRVKGWRLAAEGVKAARSTGRDVRFIVAGMGPDEGEVRRCAAEHPDWFEYVGFVHCPQVSVLPRLDAFVLMAEKEGLPMSIIEAMSSGLPVISTPVGGIPDAVIPKVTGLLIARDAACLAEALSFLYDNREALAAMSRRTLSLFAEQFEIQRIVHAYDQVYRVDPSKQRG
jgi:glycosyltransferase involved in cell wall biosynthesis